MAATNKSKAIAAKKLAGVEKAPETPKLTVAEIEKVRLERLSRM
jgi:hypothetical protein